MSPPAPPPDSDRFEWDPVYLHARRETVVIFSVWLAALLWAVPYCYLNGYAHTVEPEDLELFLGIPAWVFFGVFAPWLVANLVTVWFCFCYMQDDDLGESPEEAAEKARAAEEAGQ